MALVTSPYLTFRGLVDSAEISDSGDTATIAVQVESRLIELEKTPGRNYSLEDHKLEYSDDKFFEFVPSIQDVTISWGR
jgi:hypothetical protein